MISRLHYITQGDDAAANVLAVEKACRAGCSLVQLRIKNSTAVAIKPFAQEAKQICQHYQAQLILNDYPELAQEIGAAGVHLGLQDLPTDEARKLLGKQFIIGGTANTLADVLMHVRNGVDYVGLGPFRFTATKKKLSPVLGITGYQDIIKQLQQQQIDIPIYAIGGITLTDIPEIMQTGVHGIALSGLITHAKNQAKTVKLIQNSLL